MARTMKLDRDTQYVISKFLVAQFRKFAEEELIEMNVEIVLSKLYSVIVVRHKMNEACRVQFSVAASGECQCDAVVPYYLLCVLKIGPEEYDEATNTYLFGPFTEAELIAAGWVRPEPGELA